MNTASLEMCLEAGFKELKMPGAARAYRALIREAQQSGQDYSHFLVRLLEQELLNRRENRLKQLVREARFPELKTLDAFDFTAQPSIPRPKVLSLSQGEFLNQGESVICIGPPGTGKPQPTHYPYW